MFSHVFIYQQVLRQSKQEINYICPVFSLPSESNEINHMEKKGLMQKNGAENIHRF